MAGVEVADRKLELDKLDKHESQAKEWIVRAQNIFRHSPHIELELVPAFQSLPGAAISLLGLMRWEGHADNLTQAISAILKAEPNEPKDSAVM